MSTLGVIVLAEDDSTLRKLYSDGLAASGYDVFTASDGVQALNLLSKVTPELVLLDIMMPNLNGIETCKQARRIIGDAVPIVFLSALDRLDILQECLTAGGDDYIIKSGNLVQLFARIAHWMQRSGDQQLSDRRANLLAELATEAITTTVNSETEQSVREITEFLRQALAGAAVGFGKSVEEKLYLLGYVTGVVEHWLKSGDVEEARFFDRLSAVLRATDILTKNEICEMIAGFGELAADTRFGIARALGHNDPVQRLIKDDGYVPVGLAKCSTLLWV